MGRSTLARALVLALVGGVGAACSLVVDTKGLSAGAPLDGSTGAPDAGPRGDAASDGKASDPTLVAEWRFDEPSGAAVADSSGNGHHGTANGGARVGGRAGGATSTLQLDGTKDFVIVPPAREFDRTRASAFTMTAWMRRDGRADHAMFVSVSYGDKDSSFGIELESDTTLTFWDGTVHAAESPVNVPPGTWHHYAIVVTGDRLAIYLDGNVVGSGKVDRTERTATGVRLGGSTFGDHLPGALDVVRYYRVALDAAGVVADMNR